MQFETLYKRATTGKIVSYDISVENSPEMSTIIKLTGQLTGKKTPHRQDVLKGKQKRNIVEQAEFEALSDWKRKQDEGYKTLETLKIEPCSMEFFKGKYSYPGCGIMYMSLEYCLELCLPKFNTDANGKTKPMLAHPVKWDKVEFPCYYQPKLDGIRCLMFAGKGENGQGEVTFLSRQGKEFTTLGHIAADVEAYMYSFLPGDFILDGEIYSEELTFQEISQAVKKQYPNSLKLKFRAYDIVTDETQDARWYKTVNLVDAIASPEVWLVPTRIVDNKEEVIECHNKSVADGSEGGMLRHFKGKYAQGQRSHDLMKVKMFDEDEFRFSHFEFGQRGIQDLLAVCYTKTGGEFRATMMGSIAVKQKTYDEYKDQAGKKLTVKFFGWTDDKLPRHPNGKAFRDYEK